jgi:hypothetical protein
MGKNGYFQLIFLQFDLVLYSLFKPKYIKIIPDFQTRSRYLIPTQPTIRQYRRLIQYRIFG